jgi:hypothetical protein
MPLPAALKIDFEKSLLNFFKHPETSPPPTSGHGLKSRYPLGLYGSGYNYCDFGLIFSLKLQTEIIQPKPMHSTPSDSPRQHPIQTLYVSDTNGGTKASATIPQI